MPNPSTRTHLDRCPVIWAGRFVDQVASANLPDDRIVLSEQDIPLHELTRVLERANTLVLLDLLSFPLEVMTDSHWKVPIVVVLPSGFDAESLTTTFGSALFEHLGFLDCIVTPDSALWKKLRQKYRWSESQYVPVASNDPGEVATAICTLLEADTASLPILDGERNEAALCWHKHNRRLATSVLHRVANSSHYDLYFSKALHHAQAAVLESKFTAAQRKHDTKAPLDVLEVGSGFGRWASSFDPTKTRFVGIDVDEDLIRTARANFPNQRFDCLSSDLRFPYEDVSFDLVFSVTFMHRNSASAKRTLLSEMWRVTRPGGRLLFLEHFVFTKQPEQSNIFPMSVTEFENLIIHATDGQVVLEHVESLRYPGEDLRRGGLISLLRLGVSKKHSNARSVF